MVILSEKNFARRPVVSRALQILRRGLFWALSLSDDSFHITYNTWRSVYTDTTRTHASAGVMMIAANQSRVALS